MYYNCLLDIENYNMRCPEQANPRRWGAGRDPGCPGHHALCPGPQSDAGLSGLLSRDPIPRGFGPMRQMVPLRGQAPAQ